MDTIGNTVAAVATSINGYGWILYFAAMAAVVASTLAFDRARAAVKRGQR